MGVRLYLVTCARIMETTWCVRANTAREAERLIAASLARHSTEGFTACGETANIRTGRPRARLVRYPADAPALSAANGVQASP